MRGLLVSLGRLTLGLLRYLGGVTLLALDTLKAVFVSPLRWGLVMRQILEVGYRSQPVVIITGAFTGAVFAAQIFFQFRTLGMESGTGALVATAMCRELGPVLTGLMLAGRVGAAMSAEIGTMKVTEQIDALRALAVYPVDYLVAAARRGDVHLRAAAGGRVRVLRRRGELLTSASRCWASRGAYYMENMTKYMLPRDIFMALIKGGGVRDHHHLRELLRGPQRQGRRGRRGPRDDGSGGHRVAGDPDLEFLPDACC